MSKTCILTGGTSGIGKNLTHKLVNKGYKVYVLSRYRSKNELLNLYGSDYNKKIFYIELELEDINQIKSVLNYIKSKIKSVDLFIWNAGIALHQMKKIYTTKYKINRLLQINFISHALLTCNLIKYYPNSKYIFMSSISSSLFYFDMFELDAEKLFKRNNNPFFYYGLSKYYMNIFCCYLSNKYGLNCFSIEPGFIKSTKMNNNRNSLIMNFNEVFITKSNSMEESIDFLISKILLINKNNGNLFKFNMKTEDNYSIYNTLNLIENVILLCKHYKIETILNLKAKEIMDIKYKKSLKYKIVRTFKQTTMLYPVFVYIIVFIYAYNKKISYFAILYILICNSITKSLQRIIAEKRPKGCLDNGLIIQHRKSNSYGMPSLHSQNAFLLATIFYFNNQIKIREKIMFIIAAIVVSLTRYFFKFHSFKQVFIGCLLGIFNGLIYIRFNKHIITFLKKNIKLILILLGILLFIILYQFIKIYNYNKECLYSKIPDRFLDKRYEYDIHNKFQKKIVKNSNYHNNGIFKYFKNLSPSLSNKVMTWEVIENYLQNNNISNINYDCVIGIFSGGGFICKRLADILKIKEIGYIDSKLWTDQNLGDILKSLNTNNSKISFSDIGKIDVKGKKILLADDTVYTGITINSCKNFLLKEGASIVNTYVLITKDKSLVDYYSDINNVPLYWPWGFELN